MINGFAFVIYACIILFHFIGLKSNKAILVLTSEEVRGLFDL